METKTNTDTNVLASRWARLFASLIDTFITLAIIIPLMIYYGVFDRAESGALSFSDTLKLGFAGVILFLGLHSYLLSKYGQTIGKMLLKIKIVDLQGNKPEFFQIILKRYLPIWVITQIPLIGQLLSCLDVLFVFRKDKRCIHDLIASTRVVRLDDTNKTTF